MECSIPQNFPSKAATSDVKNLQPGQSPPKSMLHVNFDLDNEEMHERKKKYLTAKYGQHQMSLIKKRLRVEMWMYDQLQILYDSSDDSSSYEVEIDVDELLDIEAESDDSSSYEVEIDVDELLDIEAESDDSSSYEVEIDVDELLDIEAESDDSSSYEVEIDVDELLDIEAESDDSSSYEVEIDVDELLDIEAESARRDWLRNKLVGVKQSEEAVEKFITELLQRCTTL
ncbi:unnamed protein product [Larinioides sclopetarius]|uniref:Uncharacterized protein n=1 Tax=Larinioides sclopetarius TaxID=280406 RepID=A0AAV2BJE6_9ARAC